MRHSEHLIGGGLRHHKRQIDGETIDKIPTIASKLVINMFNEAYGSVESNCLLAADQQPQQAIKADEVVDVRVRDEDVLQALDLSW